jgi:PhnB protein
LNVTTRARENQTMSSPSPAASDTKAPSPVPEGYPTVIPYLVVPDGEGLINFVTSAFGATLNSRTDTPSGRLMHAEISLGGSRIMLGESNEAWPPTRAMIHLYLPDVDGVYRRALEAGAISLREPETMFYGDRSGGVQDPSGTQWWIATRVEEVSPEEMERRQREGWTAEEEP